MRRLGVGLLTIGALLCGASTAQAQAQAQGKGQATDLTARNREVMSKFNDLFYTSHDVKAAFETYVAKDYIQHSPGIADGRDAAIALLAPMFSRPAFIVHVRRVLVDGDYATVMVHADRQGPTGGAIIDVYRLKDGKIVEHWDVNEIIPAKAANPHPFF